MTLASKTWQLRNEKQKESVKHPDIQSEIEAYFAKGGEITHVPPGATGETLGYNNKSARGGRNATATIRANKK